MRSGLFVYAIVASGIVFASGIAVGQKAARSKFDKYLRPAARTEMDWIALEAQITALQWAVPFVDGMSAPRIFFNHDTNQMQARVLVSADFEKAPLETVKKRISGQYYYGWLLVMTQLPEVSEDDFVLTVWRTPDNNKPATLFAECKHGNIVFH